MNKKISNGILGQVLVEFRGNSGMYPVALMVEFMVDLKGNFIRNFWDSSGSRL